MKADQSEKREGLGFDFKEFESEAIAGLQAGRPLFGSEGILKQLVKHLVEASLEGELDDHLREHRAADISNKRNGKGRVKRLRTELGEIEVQSSRDRRGDFAPQTVGKWQRELGESFSNQVLELYAMGNSVGDIRLHLEKIYGVELSGGAISAITERVREEVMQWQSRPLASLYVLIYLDAVHYKVREEGKVVSKAVYTIYSVDAYGERDILAIHVGPNEGSHQWSLYLEDLKRRGVEDVLYFAVDGLKGFPEAIGRVFPEAIIQRCIVHMLRTSLIGVSDKDRREVLNDLKPVYQAADEAQAQRELEKFEQKWGKRYAHIGRSWRENWIELTAFLDVGTEIRRMLYTTNPVENLHRQMRSITKSKGAWCSPEALIKQLYLSLQRNKKSWNRKAFKWNAIQNELIEIFGDRYLNHLKR
jgi:transposase-like protein